MVLRLVSVALVTLVTAACATDATVSSSVETAQPRPTPVVRYTPEPTQRTTVTPTPAPMSDMEVTSRAPDWTALPVAASDAVSLAAQLVMVESGLRDPNVSGAQLRYFGHLEQLALGRLVDYPEWQPTVLAALSPLGRRSIDGSLAAGKELRSMSSVIPTRLPDWRIVDPAPLEELLSYYKEAEAQFGVGWYYLAAIHLVETRMGRIRGLSSTGAQGPMQFMPATWAQYGRGDVNSNHDAIMGAARYLVAAGAPGNMQRALFAYNHAQAYVNALVYYADVMKNDPNAYRGYWGWQVYYPTKDGPIYMPAGWTKP